MKTVKNNEGKMVKVDLACYNGMKRDFQNGVFIALIQDKKGNPHTIVLGDNFAF